MDTRPINFATQSYQARSGNVSAERLVNWYLERNPESAKGPVALHNDPGLKLWSTVGNGPCRGLIAMGPDIYVVSGGELYAVDSSKTATLIGTIVGTGNVRLTENGTHIAVATTSKLYASNRSAHLELPRSGMNGAAFQDGYGLFSQALTQNFWITGLDDMTTISALDFSTADAKPDFVIGLASNRREVWIHKQKTTEVWINTGASGFPFARAGGGFIERGCAAPGSIANDGERMFWLGDDLRVYASQGYNPQPISTPPIEILIKATVDPHTAESFIYDLGGHKCYVLAFSDLTILYDLTTGLWRERASYGIDRWRANGFAKFGDKLLVGDYANGKIYELDLGTFTENGTEIVRTAVAPPIHAGGERRLSMPFAYIDFEVGVGLVSGQGSDPKCMLDWSDDGGQTWVGQHTATLGKIGERYARAQFANLGAFRSRHLRVTVSDPVKCSIVGAHCGLEAFA